MISHKECLHTVEIARKQKKQEELSNCTQISFYLFFKRMEEEYLGNDCGRVTFFSP